MGKRNRYPGKIRKLRRRLPKLVSTRKIRPCTVQEKFSTRERIERGNLSSTKNMDYMKDMVDDILRAHEASVKSNTTGSVFLNDDSILIRLEEIDETNFELLFSTIKRLDKDWEITKVNDESFFKVCL